MSSIMSIKFKVLSPLIFVSLLGCTGNSDTETLAFNSDIKNFSGVVNNASVKGIDVSAIPIGKHGQFRLNDDGEVEARTKSSDERGRYRFSVEGEEVGPYILTAAAPEYTAETESVEAAKASCQIVNGCTVNGEFIVFGEYYSLAPELQWSAAIDSVSDGQFIVVNPITEMARVFGFSIYVNGPTDTDVSDPNVPAANYYSNYAVVKGNSQTASLLGLGDILSIEPVNLSLLNSLDVDSSASIQESIRYGALLAAWQQLELEFNKDLSDGESPFQSEVISQYILNGGQLYKSAALDNQVLTLKQWYQTALSNLIALRDDHSPAITGAVLSNTNLVITRFESEIENLSEVENNGVLTTAFPVNNPLVEAEYGDAIQKSKAMVNYLSNLQSNFATADYRKSIKDSSDLVTAETRRLSPKLDGLLGNLLLIHQYYMSCTQGACDEQSIWNQEGNIFVADEQKLTIVQAQDTKLELSQGRVFDDLNPEGSDSTNVHDLYISGAIEFEGLRLELSDFISETTEGLKSSLRFSFSEPLSELPLPPLLLVGGKGVSENELLVPDYIELVMPNFKLYDSSQVGLENEMEVSGAFSAVMIANTDINDLLKEPEEKLGKRYNLSSVRATLKLIGKNQDEEGSDIELRDNAVIYLEAVASEAFISDTNFSAYFPDSVYPSFENFFKPREGFSIGEISPIPLVISRLGTMNLPALNAEGQYSDDGTTVVVQYVELDYEIGGIERYIVYPKAEGEDEYWGLICAAQPEDEEDLMEAGGGYTKPVVDSEGEPVLDDEGNQLQRALLTCPFRNLYAGEATTDDFVNKVYQLNKDLFNLREYNGQGTYRIVYPVTNDVLEPFIDGAQHYGKMEETVILGVDSMRLQFKPELVSQSGNSYLPESMLDISLVWRTHDLIDVNAFLAFDSGQVVNNPNGSGLPYLAVGSDSESYSIAYRTDANGNESGEYVMAWAGVNFVDGPIDGTKVMQRTDDDNLKEGAFAGIGSNVTYSPYTAQELEKLGSIDGVGVNEEKCGFFARGNTPTDGEDCEAIAYLTYRGLVTGSLREERDGAYIIRYIDGSWQILGAQ